MKTGLNLILLLITFLSALTTYSQGQEMPPALVKTGKIISKMIIPRTEQIGTTYFSTASGLSTEIPGLAKEVAFEEGDTIKKGDILVTLDVEILQKEIEIQEAVVKQYKSSCKLQEKVFNRKKSLRESNTISENEFDLAYYTMDELRNKVAQEEIRLSLLQLKLKKSKIAAPYDALVVKKDIGKGDWLNTGTEIATLARLDSLRLQVPVFEHYLKYITKDKPLDVIMSVSGKEYKAEFDGLRPTADSRTKNVYIKLKLPNLKHPIENLSAKVMIPTAEAKSSLVVIRDAIISSPMGKVVYTIKDGKAEAVSVKVIENIGIHAVLDPEEITDGMVVVVDGNERLQPGRAVMETE